VTEPVAANTALGDVDDPQAEVARRVAAAWARGEYPEGIDDDLLTEFARLVDRRVGTSPFGQLRDEVPRLRAAADLVVERPPTTSRLPGGSAAHETIARLVARHVTPLEEATRAYAKAATDCLALIARGLDDEDPGHQHPELHGLLDAVLDRLATLERRMPAAGSSGPAAALVAPASPRLVVADWDDEARAAVEGLVPACLGGLAVERVGLDAVGAVAAAATTVLRSDGIVAVGATAAAAPVLADHGFVDVVASGAVVHGRRPR
jgi:hypothetical protein